MDRKELTDRVLNSVQGALRLSEEVNNADCHGYLRLLHCYYSNSKPGDSGRLRHRYLSEIQAHLISEYEIDVKGMERFPGLYNYVKCARTVSALGAPLLLATPVNAVLGSIGAVCLSILIATSIALRRRKKEAVTEEGVAGLKEDADKYALLKKELKSIELAHLDSILQENSERIMPYLQA